MPTYTSTTSGHFTSSATWGGAGYPNLNGDIFNISDGHTVTYDAGITPLTTGFNNSNIYGTLDMTSGSNLVMNGTLFVQTNGLLNMDRATLAFSGSNTDIHGLWVENLTSASFIASGSDPMPVTTLTAAVNPGDVSMSFASATNFAVGEWVAVYRERPASIDEDNDEGVWIHDISGNTVYFREFVGPTAVISAAASNYIDVDNSKVFRKKQKLIFGTGATRNTMTVSSIDYTAHRITFTQNLASTNVVGQTVYTTGFHKYHPSGDLARKMATIPSATANSGATQITLVNAAGFDIGDEFIIEHTIGASTSYTVQVRHTITNKSTNTLTFTPALPAAVATSSLCMVLSRDCVVKALNSTDRPFVYSEYFSTNYSKRLYLKNVHFDGLGNNQSSIYSGVVSRAFHRTDFRTNGGIIEGCSFTNDYNRSDRAGLWMYSECHFSLVRCNVAYKTHSGIANYYSESSHYFNNYSAYADLSTFRHEGMYGNRWEIAYNKSHRADDYGFYLYAAYEPGLGFHHNLIDAGNQYPFNIIANGPCELWQNEFRDIRYAPRVETPSGMMYKFIYNKFISRNASYPHGQLFGSGYGDVFRGNFTVFTNNEADYEFDSVEQWNFHAYRKWDHIESAWKVERRDDSSGNAGFSNLIYVPQGETVYATFSVKLFPGFNGSQPKAFIIPFNSVAYSTAASLPSIFNSVVWSINGERNITTFSANDSTFTDLTISLTNESVRGRNYIVGIYTDNSNASEGYYSKPVNIQISGTPYDAMREDTLKTDVQTLPTNFIAGKKTRLGGIRFNG